jgi:hypothetical protein
VQRALQSRSIDPLYGCSHRRIRPFISCERARRARHRNRP